ncbi:threonine synthase [Thomasclavelia saccharogumia]|uniref:threonine synthase n=1 Tax=Thomasclavelia saccharogumia TaxID=341225 RepID=UPI00047B751F|nr:threonine synthase [Thomasclavelia saccharogumia]
MEKKYVSTRNLQKEINFYQAIVQGIGEDGGLLVPNFDFTKMDLEALSNLNYVDLATEVLSTFVPEDGKELIHEACLNAYGKGLFPEIVVPVKKAGDVYVAELFHGQTAAFKDMALSLLPYLMTLSLKQLNEQREVMILAATSGDTGKAALEGFKDVAGTCIKVFYPLDGVSAIQQQQMVSQTGKNVKVIGIHGNFDDAQTAVKKAFASDELKVESDKHNVFLSSANSINVGRLIPQIVYYFHSYFELVRNDEINLGDQVNFCVPSGNFGNCLAGYFAKQMGLPINKFICASNKNNILTDFFTTGRYDANREFYKTNAPAMDILVSSNLERLVWFMSDGDGDKVRSYMDKLNSEGVYEVDEETYEKIKKQFKAGYLNEDEVLQTIKQCFNETGYLLDTHTAIGYGVLKQYQKDSGDDMKTILLSTASPYKFPESVYKAIYDEELDVYSAIEKLNERTAVPVPRALAGIKDRAVLHKEAIDKTEIISFIKSEIEAM